MVESELIVGRVGRVPLPPLPARATMAARRTEANATLILRADVSGSVARFIIQPDGGPIEFRPGQYVGLGLEMAGRLVERPYSIASGEPGTRTIELLMRLVPGGALTPALWNAPPGTRVHLGRAKGRLLLASDIEGPHLFICTGTGVAPFVGMLRWLAASGSPSSAVVIHGVSRREDLAYRPEFEQWQRDGLVSAYVPTVSRPEDPANAGWNGRTGRAEAIVGDVCDEWRLRAGATAAYLCGNPAMVNASEDVLRSRGFPDDHVRSERFWTPPPSDPGSGTIRGPQ